MLVARACQQFSRRSFRQSQFRQLNNPWKRALSTAATEAEEIMKEPRESMEFDVVTVGGGPAGLALAIRLKQLAKEQNREISVCLIDKGSEIGAHIISGNVFEPRALNELFPDWKNMPDVPLQTPATSDHFLFLTEKGSLSIPHFLLPQQLHNEGNYIISLSQLTRWLAERAEELGVEIYPGFAADEVLFTEDGKTVRGVATKDAGISKSGEVKDSFARGMELLGKQTVFAEGCRGSCSEELIKKFNLREGRDVQTYGLGVKEVWRVQPNKHRQGHIQHTVGWPLDTQTFGGTFLYHQGPDLVHLGMVVGLDYANPHISPYQEFQRWKTHPQIASLLEGGECISYGARCLNEGGYHAIPKLSFPGGLLVGCSAGFLNAVKIKGSHTAMKSGMLAAESIFARLVTDTAAGAEVVEYEPSVMNSWIGDELKIVRNTHAAFKYGGLIPGMLHSGLSCLITQGKEPWTLRNTVNDSDRTKPAKDFAPISYPKPDNKISFDLLTNLQRSGTNHDHDQPSHLRIKPACASVPLETSLPVYNGPEQRFCPAGVYEYVDDVDKPGSKKLQINAQNCVHCKCCSIKTPKQFIQWTVPEGGGGPSYTVM